MSIQTEPDAPNARPALTAPQIIAPPGTLPLDEVDARNAAQFGQFRHDNTIAPLSPRPGDTVAVEAVSGSGLALTHAAIYYTSDGSHPGVASARVAMRVTGSDWDARAGYLTHWRAELPAQPAGTLVRYRIGGWRDTGPVPAHEKPDLWASDGQGFWFHYTGANGITTFAYLVTPDAGAAPDWVRDAVIYHIFLDRFHPETDDGAFAGEDEPRARHGGTLRGVRRALPYLHDLGVTCLWLSPLCASDTYHRYDTTDLYAVDPTLGSEQDLRDLVDDAHARGMRVLLDLVPSHCSWRHPAFEAARRDAGATTRDWFIFEQWPQTYRNFLGVVPSLPSFNTDDPGARAHIIGSAVHWLRDCGVDGFRLDHAIGPSMDFWTAFRLATRATKSDSYTLGEVTDTPECVRRYRGRLDGILDFLLARALSLTFGTGAWGAAALDGFLRAHESFMADGPARVGFLDNHDMTRFLYLAGGETRRLKMAALCLFTLAVTPAIYYGTEVGLTQQASFEVGGDAEARRDMPWRPEAWDHDLLSFFRALTRLRAGRRALRHGARRTVHLDDAAGTYAYLRAEPEASNDAILAAFNLSGEERTITLPAPADALTCLLATGLAPSVRVSSSNACITLAPLSAALLGRTMPS